MQVKQVTTARVKNYLKAERGVNRLNRESSLQKSLILNFHEKERKSSPDYLCFLKSLY
jgi:hypothetical protein